MIDTKHLRTLAEAATPGPWTIYTDEVISPIVAAMELSKLAHGSVFTPVLPMVVGSNGLVTAVTGCGPTSVANADFIAACSPDVVLALLDALERKDNLLREQLTICKYLSRSICMTDETGADTNPDNIVDSSIEAITKEIGT